MGSDRFFEEVLSLQGEKIGSAVTLDPILERERNSCACPHFHNKKRPDRIKTCQAFRVSSFFPALFALDFDTGQIRYANAQEHDEKDHAEDKAQFPKVGA